MQRPPRAEVVPVATKWIGPFAHEYIARELIDGQGGAFEVRPVDVVVPRHQRVTRIADQIDIARALRRQVPRQMGLEGAWLRRWGRVQPASVKCHLEEGHDL